MKPHTQDRLSRYTKTRTRRVSRTPWDIPEEHLEREAELEDYRLSGFHDPIGLRFTNTEGYNGTLDEDKGVLPEG